MDVALLTEAEKKAEKAEKLAAFIGVSLLNIKQKIAILLNLIGHGEIFDQYTRHDISHINEMLKILEWLIPSSTKEIMSPADWLLTVLAIYFHDLGMLVTKKEYESRDSSQFRAFCLETLFAGSDGEDYRVKVQQRYSDPNKYERFLYQEFIRHKHAERIRMWITGKAPISLGVTHEVMQEIDKLLEPLSPQFRRDLALICESHHLDDLNDFKKYRVSQPYGNSDEETANLQYAAVLLRTADLLHITFDRTPTIAFRIINPTDPISQEEWAKQRAVTRVRSQIGRDRENNPDENAHRDTIEVFAHFTEVSGFFGLTSYLKYAAGQIQKTYEWAKAANSYQRAHHKFPWRYIDDTNIEAEGFMRNAFEFTIDQAKILDLLTGHTLYNDTNVVIRELIQNSLDAIRLQKLLDPDSSPGKVEIHWDSRNHILSIRDNGTGMTQDIIERHLLKVGSSRYQDSEFKKQFPTFSSISRFGIGVLSTFMIADSVEVTTCHPDEDEARQISLRSVHGKYLIRLLDKQIDETAKQLAHHGTVVKLTVRPSSQMVDVIKAAQRWIVIPNCDVAIIVDDSPPVKIGASSLREFLTQVLQENGILKDIEDATEPNARRIRVEQKSLNDVEVAYALEWSEYFREWTFLRSNYEGIDDRREKLPFGTCIEGIRVDFKSPGFQRSSIVALANATGSNAPKTNVARSGLETTPERDEMLRNIYLIYTGHILNELQELYQRRGFSLTWATQEARYLLNPLLTQSSSSTEPLNSSLLTEAIRRLPLLLVEHNGQRRTISPMDLSNEVDFWTIDCALFNSAERLLKEVPSEASVSNLISALNTRTIQLPDGPLLCGQHTLYNSALEEYVFEHKEVDMIKIYKDQRRIDFHWAERTSPPRWLKTTDIITPILDFQLRRYKRRHLPKIVILQGKVEILGVSDELAIKSLSAIYLLSNSLLGSYLVSLSKSIEKTNKERIVVFSALVNTVSYMLSEEERFIDTHAFSEDRLKDRLKSEMGDYTYFSRDLENELDLINIKELYNILKHENTKCFDPSAWQRSQD